MRPPMMPGTMTLNGKPWSGDKSAPFCMYAKIMSRDGSIAYSFGILVPYLDPPPPPGKSSAPSKHTLRAPSLRL
uniref:Nitrate reductase n=1 Tax=Rhizophora mucronata TaxID=61149 RepID=A0A2P2JNL7_RHIMU